MLRRKIDDYLSAWKLDPNRKPLLVYGGRQIGKTTSIREFGKKYGSFVEINFATEPSMKTVFSKGYDVDSILMGLSLFNPSFRFLPHDTLILFDEVQECPDALTCLKPFSLDGRYDVICSGSLLGVHYKRISSIPVGYKQEYRMRSLDFEEFLWANGISEEQIERAYSCLSSLSPLPDAYLLRFKELFEDYIFVGGMPEAVNAFVSTKLFSAPFEVQMRISRDYDDDIGKYVEGLDSARVRRFYRHIGSQLSRENHKFQVSKIGHGSRWREYEGVEEWLRDAGVIEAAHNLKSLHLPLNAEEEDDNFRVYYADHGLFIASLDEEAKDDLRLNGNYDIYYGALYENLVAESLSALGYPLYFYRSDNATIELDFVLRAKNEIIPVEVKRNRGRSKSLKAVLDSDLGISHAVKLTGGNIGFDGRIFTLPYSLSFLLKRFLKESEKISW